jgi:hypothetical protein
VPPASRSVTQPRHDDVVVVVVVVVPVKCVVVVVLVVVVPVKFVVVVERTTTSQCDILFARHTVSGAFP